VGVNSHGSPDCHQSFFESLPGYNIFNSYMRVEHYLPWINNVMSTWTGCTITSACNFDPSAVISDNSSCVYADCAGVCDGNAYIDCEGKCVTGSCKFEGNIQDWSCDNETGNETCGCDHMMNEWHCIHHTANSLTTGNMLVEANPCVWRPDNVPSKCSLNPIVYDQLTFDNPDSTMTIEELIQWLEASCDANSTPASNQMFSDIWGWEANNDCITEAAIPDDAVWGDPSGQHGEDWGWAWNIPDLFPGWKYCVFEPGGPPAEVDECGICNGPGAIYSCGCENNPYATCNCDGTVWGSGTIGEYCNCWGAIDYGCGCDMGQPPCFDGTCGNATDCPEGQCNTGPPQCLCVTTGNPCDEDGIIDDSDLTCPSNENQFDNLDYVAHVQMGDYFMHHDEGYSWYAALSHPAWFGVTPYRQFRRECGPNMIQTPAQSFMSMCPDNIYGWCDASEQALTTGDYVTRIGTLNSYPQSSILTIPENCGSCPPDYYCSIRHHTSTCKPIVSFEDQRGGTDVYEEGTSTTNYFDSYNRLIKDYIEPEPGETL
jgi:hypothetical protein